MYKPLKPLCLKIINTQLMCVIVPEVQGSPGPLSTIVSDYTLYLAEKVTGTGVEKE